MSHLNDNLKQYVADRSRRDPAFAKAYAGALECQWDHQVSEDKWTSVLEHNGDVVAMFRDPQDAADWVADQNTYFEGP
jgi:hypothetical protein